MFTSGFLSESGRQAPGLAARNPPTERWLVVFLRIPFKQKPVIRCSFQKPRPNPFPGQQAPWRPSQVAGCDCHTTHNADRTLDSPTNQVNTESHGFDSWPDEPDNLKLPMAQPGIGPMPVESDR